MPRPTIFFIAVSMAVLLIAPTIAYAWPPRPVFTAFYGDNQTMTIVPLSERLLGGITPGQEYVASLTARGKHDLAEYCGASAGIAVEAGGHRVAAGIQVRPENAYLLLHKVVAYLVLYVDGHQVGREKLGEIGPGGGSREWHGTARVTYHCNGRIEIRVEASGVTMSYMLQANGTARIYATTGEAGFEKFGGCASDVSGQTYIIEHCQANTDTNPYGDPSGSQHGDEPVKNDDSKLLYAAAGLGGLLLLLALARPSGGVVVVGRGRGMLQIIGVLLLLAFAAGAAMAWKLSNPHPSQIVYAVAGLGLLLVFLLILASRNRTEVVVVEGG